MDLACSINLLCFGSSIFSHVRYSYSSILPDVNVNIFESSLLIIYWSFSTLILLSIFIISVYILSKRLFLKLKGLFDARVILITNKEFGFAVQFFKKFMKPIELISDE